MEQSITWQRQSDLTVADSCLRHCSNVVLTLGRPVRMRISSSESDVRKRLVYGYSKQRSIHWPFVNRPTMVYASLAIVLLVLYIAFDVNYFIRVAFLIGFGSIFKKKVNILGKSSIYGWCTTQDLDIFMRHMNNSRFIRDLDFARFDFYVLSGLYELMRKQDGHALQGACTIRYRRPIQTFSLYKIETKLIYWEEKAIYLEHRFVTLDNFVRAIVISKQNAINFNPVDFVKTLSKDKYKEPEMPEELSQWLTSVETLSAKLRKSD